MTWRERSTAIILKILVENPSASNEELRKLVSKAYPFSARKGFAYQAWLKAVESLLGPSEKKLAAIAARVKADKARLEALGQKELF